jgi:lipopolysaccharide transport system permease protein
MANPINEATVAPDATQPTTPLAIDPPSTLERPELLIEAKPPGLRFALAELWRYRELLYFLTWRDIKLRYKQTVLGVAWAIIQPLFAMLLFTLIFGRIAQMPSDGIPYPLFAYAGLVPWTFFATAVTNSGNSLIGNTTLITKVYFPRMFIPASAVVASLLDLAIALLLLLPLLLYYQVKPTGQLLLLPAFIMLLTLPTLGLGMSLAALNVRYRDIRYAMPFFIQFWLFATPIIYPLSIVPERWKWLLAVNPMTGIIEGIRAALFGTELHWTLIAPSIAVSLILLGCSIYIFRRVEETFADTI